MVAASRMKRATSAVLAGRPYSQKLAEVISNVAGRVDTSDSDSLSPLLRSRPVKNVALIVITADKGLTGALNTNVIRRATRFILDEAGAPVSIIAVGRKGRDFMLRYGRPLIADFTNLGDRPTLKDVAPIARVATEEFVSGRVDAVYLLYSDFVNTLVQKPNVYRLLPVDPGAGAEGEGHSAADGAEFEFEPSVQGVLAQLLPRYVEIRIYQALLEHVASEQSAKLVAMRNATQNAKDMISDLTLAYNKLRQANITREIIEVSSGAAALTG